MSLFTTVTRKSATEISCDINTTYLIDNLFLPTTPISIIYPQNQQHQHQHQHQQQEQQQLLDHGEQLKVTTGVSDFGSFPLQHTNHAGIVPTIPLENLSINQNTTNEEWISTLDYSEFSQHDMNFLFNYNGLADSRELPDISTATAAGSTEVSDPNPIINKEQKQQDFKKRNTEQIRRFSMMDSSIFDQQETNRLTKTVGQSFKYQQHTMHPSSTPTVSSNFCINYNSYYPNQQEHHQHKERSSIPDLFKSNNNYGYYSTAAAATDTHVSWQQSSLVLSRTTSVECTPLLSTTPTPTAMNSFTSSPSELKNQTKKRTLLEGFNQDYSPSVVSSISDPIPTTLPTSHWMTSRKRNKSIRSTNHYHSVTASSNNIDDNKSSSSVISSNSTSQLFPSLPTKYTASVDPSSTMNHNVTLDHRQYHPHEQLVMSSTLSYPIFHDDDKKNSDGNSVLERNNNSSSNQILAAMPRRQKLRYDGDHYTPKWVRYTGHLKEGYCDSCHPGKWLQLKNSAYWYHKQFYHGISSVSGKSFMKPLEQRIGKGDTIEGLCHQCHRFLPACNGKKKNNYMLWYRHAHKCHLYNKPKATTISKSLAQLSSNDISPPAVANITKL